MAVQTFDASIKHIRPGRIEFNLKGVRQRLLIVDPGNFKVKKSPTSLYTITVDMTKKPIPLLTGIKPA